MKLLALLSLLVLAACAGAQKGRKPVAELRIVAVPEAAVVQVNEQFVGSARVLDKRPARLTPGKKRVTVEAPGYFPHDLEVVLAEGVTTVNIKLRPIPR
jgi:hypothetical protein